MGIKQCPLERKYRFKTHCKVMTCKNYTESTENRCLGLDVEFADEVTDVELQHYKRPDLSLKECEKIRKKAVLDVRNMLSLYYAVNHIRNNFKPFVLPLTEELKILINHKVFQNELLNFEAWMLRYVFVENFMERITSSKFSLNLLLGITPTTYNFLKNEIKTQYKLTLEE